MGDRFRYRTLWVHRDQLRKPTPGGDREPGICSWCITCSEILLKFDYRDFEPASNCYCSVCGTGMPPGAPPGKPR